MSSILGRTGRKIRHYEITSILGRTGREKDRMNLDENMGTVDTGRLVHQVCMGDTWYDAADTPLSRGSSLKGLMEFYIGTPVGENFMSGRPEEFFIGTPVPGGPGTPPQTGERDDDEISGVARMSVLGRTSPDENLHWERSVNRTCVDTHEKIGGEMKMNETEMPLKGPMQFFIGTRAGDDVMRGRPEEFFIGTPAPTLGTPDMWQPAGETVLHDNLQGTRSNGCDMYLNSLGTDVGPDSSALERLCLFVGWPGVETQQFLGPYACGGQNTNPQTSPQTLGDCLKQRPLLGHGMEVMDNIRGEVRERMRDEAGAHARDRIPHGHDVLELRIISHESSRMSQPHPCLSSVLAASTHDVSDCWCRGNGQRMSRDLSCEPGRRIPWSFEANLEVDDSRRLHGNIIPKTFKGRSGIHGQLESHGSAGHEEFRSCEDELQVRHCRSEDCWREHGRTYGDEMRQARHSQEAESAVETASEVLQVGRSQAWWGTRTRSCENGGENGDTAVRTFEGRMRMQLHSEELDNAALRDLEGLLKAELEVHHFLECDWHLVARAFKEELKVPHCSVDCWRDQWRTCGHEPKVHHIHPEGFREHVVQTFESERETHHQGRDAWGFPAEIGTRWCGAWRKAWGSIIILGSCGELPSRP